MLDIPIQLYPKAMQDISSIINAIFGNNLAHEGKDLSDAMI